jgi:hypothetical protein
VGGLIKPGVAPGAEVAKETKMHVTYIQPDQVLYGAHRYACDRHTGQFNIFLHYDGQAQNIFRNHCVAAWDQVPPHVLRVVGTRQASTHNNVTMKLI